MNFKTLILLSLILLGGICTGCDRFLDVQPKDQYTENTTVQRNYPIGSVDLNRNHSSDVLV